RTNREMERRRRYIETLLENLTPGVISINQDGRVTTINRSACGILGLSRPEDLPGLELGEILSRPEHRGLAALAEEVVRSGERGLERPLTLSSPGRTLTITATLTPLYDGDGERMGMIMVLEDVTQLIRAEKAAAWQEVARRLAHEIKNPLTPIQLSAQRIAKKFKEQSPGLLEVVAEGTGVIVNEVSALKTLLDEFSQFARLPTVNRVPSDLHQVLDQAIALYDGLHPGVRFKRDYDPHGAHLSLDREQMKRVCVNLFDNAVEAMGVKGTIHVRTRQSRNGGGFRLEVSDEGKGIPLGDRDRMFLPYFSTKKKGTGLGLAIVNRIIADHEGTIRFEANEPRGSRFVIELPASG
ncbi:MAG: PAS domain-containing sensor histidine kinase, partial [Acidobacteriota bacterium]